MTDIESEPKFIFCREASSYAYYQNGLFLPGEFGLFTDIVLPVMFTGSVKRAYDTAPNAHVLEHNFRLLETCLQTPLYFYAKKFDTYEHRGKFLIRAVADTSTVRAQEFQAIDCNTFIGQKGHVQKILSLGQTTDRREAAYVTSSLTENFILPGISAILQLSGAKRH